MFNKLSIYLYFLFKILYFSKLHSNAFLWIRLQRFGNTYNCYLVIYVVTSTWIILIYLKICNIMIFIHYSREKTKNILSIKFKKNGWCVEGWSILHILGKILVVGIFSLKAMMHLWIQWKPILSETSSFKLHFIIFLSFYLKINMGRKISIFIGTKLLEAMKDSFSSN